MNRTTRLSLLALSLALAGAVAFAAQGGKEANDALASAQARTTLGQAVTVAEQHANGRASRAEFARTKQGAVYDVEVVSAGKVVDVRVDADLGTVLSSAEDLADREDEHDEQD